MEDELYKEVYRILKQTGNNKVPQRGTYTDEDILLTYLWAVLHDRPVYWACKKKNWPIWYRRRPLPTASTMSRRLRTDLVQGLMRQLEQQLQRKFPVSLCRWIDAKPLPIGGNSKDEQSAFGRGAGCIARGYKIYAVADANQGFVCWTIRPMNQNEAKVAPYIIKRVETEGYLIGDNAYDKNNLYQVAAQSSIQLVAAQKNSRGIGHRRHSPHRLRARELLNHLFGQGLLVNRLGIERMFGNLTTFAGCGLGPLPHWVRTIFRVRLWVWAKMILFYIWRAYKHEQRSA